MRSEVDLTIFVAGISFLWFVWDLGIKKWLLDAFRERLFEIRFSLFRLGMSGEVPFDSEAYRSIETLISGLLRFAHHVTFVTFLLSSKEQEQAKKEKGYVDYAHQIELKILQTPPATQEKLRKILKDVHTVLMLYMGLSSLLFMASSVILLFREGVHAVRDTKAHGAAVFEEEAYRQESRRPRLITT